VAYGSAEISATDLALFADDKPLLLGKNYLRDVSDLDWRESGSFSAGADAPHADGPTTYAYDDQDYLQTYPATSPNTWYLIIDFGASNLAVVDSVVILNHNLNTEGVTVSVEFCTAQDGDFSPAQTAATDTPSSDKRLAFLELYHTGSTALRYSDVRYMRLKFTGTTIQPKLGEVIIGRRRQLKRGPHGAHDPKNLRSKVGLFDSNSGVLTSYEYHRNRQYFAALIRAHEAAYITDWETFFETDTEGGTLPFIWIAQPTTTPSDALWLQMPDPALNGPYRNWTERAFALGQSMEKGPNFLSAGV
jgi:hypothetical protein